MTCLVDTIEDAFREAVATTEGEVTCTRVVEAIEQYCKAGDDERGSLEGIVNQAYIDAQRVWGIAWRVQSGEVAERICDGLRAWLRTPGAL